MQATKQQTQEAKPATPQYPLTEAAQDVPGVHANMQAFRDEQAARLYRHGCKMEGDRAKLVEALRIFRNEPVDMPATKQLVNRNIADALLRELGEGS